jgi:hypothetical protein
MESESMMRKTMSIWAKIITDTNGFAFLAWIVWCTYQGTGIPGWFNRAQASFDGTYHPELTVLLLLLPCVYFGFVLGLIFDRVTGLGPIYPGPENPVGQRFDDRVIAERNENLR